MSTFLRPMHFIAPPPRVPLCRMCKYFEKGNCKLFIQPMWNDKIVYVNTVEARTNPQLCGPVGEYYVDSGRDHIWSPEDELSL